MFFFELGIWPLTVVLLGLLILEIWETIRLKSAKLANFVWIVTTLLYFIAGIFAILNVYKGVNNGTLFTSVYMVFFWFSIFLPVALPIPFAAEQSVAVSGSNSELLLIVIGFAAIVFSMLSFMAMQKVHQNKRWSFVFIGLAIVGFMISIYNAISGGEMARDSFPQFVTSIILLLGAINVYRVEKRKIALTQ